MKFNLLYQVSRDGDRISTFTKKVSKKCPTIILIKTTENYKFGDIYFSTMEYDRILYIC